jgi:hypothetical protein
MGLPGGWRWLQWLRTRPVLCSRCQDHCSPHMRAAESDSGVHHRVVSAGDAVGGTARRAPRRCSPKSQPTRAPVPTLSAPLGERQPAAFAAVLRGLLQHCSNPPIASQGLSLLCALCMQSDASNHCPSWWIASSIHPDLINGRDTQVGRIFASHSRDSSDYIRVSDQRLDPAPTVLQAVRWNLSEKLAPLCHGSQP